MERGDHLRSPAQAYERANKATKGAADIDSTVDEMEAWVKVWHQFAPLRALTASVAGAADHQEEACGRDVQTEGKRRPSAVVAWSQPPLLQKDLLEGSKTVQQALAAQNQACTASLHVDARSLSPPQAASATRPWRPPSGLRLRRKTLFWGARCGSSPLSLTADVSGTEGSVRLLCCALLALTGCVQRVS